VEDVWPEMFGLIELVVLQILASCWRRPVAREMRTKIVACVGGMTGGTPIDHEKKSLNQRDSAS
jgi:hypothetical protein